MNYTHAQRVRICCHNTDLVHVNEKDKLFPVFFNQALMLDPLWSETCWSTFKYFIILIVSTYYILCISWIIQYLIIIDELCKHEDVSGSSKRLINISNRNESQRKYSNGLHIIIFHFINNKQIKLGYFWNIIFRISCTVLYWVSVLSLISHTPEHRSLTH